MDNGEEDKEEFVMMVEECGTAGGRTDRAVAIGWIEAEE